MTEIFKRRIDGRRKFIFVIFFAAFFLDRLSDKRARTHAHNNTWVELFIPQYFRSIVNFQMHTELFERASRDFFFANAINRADLVPSFRVGRYIVKNWGPIF